MYLGLVLVAVAAVLVVGVSAAEAAYTNTPASALRDCGSGHYPLKGHYSIKVLQTALHELQAESLQYTNCADELIDTIERLELRAHHTLPHTSRGTLPPRAKVMRAKPAGVGKPTADRHTKRTKRVKTDGSAPATLPTGQTAAPEAVTAHSASFASSLPTPLLAVLAALLATVIAVTAQAIRRIARARHPPIRQ